MRSSIPVVVVFLAACASGPSSPVVDPMSGRSTVTISSGDGSGVGTVTTDADTKGAVAALAAPVDRVWSVLPAVYREVGIAVGTIQPDSHTLGNIRFTVTRKLAGERISKLLRCGSDAFGAPLADSHRITVSLLTQLSLGAEGGTQVENYLQATAANPGVSTAPVNCTSTGVLEARIANRLALLAAS